MNRHQFLKLGAVRSGAGALGGVTRIGSHLALAQSSAVPTVDRLVMTTAVDNVYDNFAKAGWMGQVMVQRTGVAYPVASGSQLEHYRVACFEHRQDRPVQGRLQVFLAVGTKSSM